MSLRGRDAISLEELFRKFRQSFYVIIVGDACMNPYELFVENGSIDYWETHREPGIASLRKLQEHYSATVWLNPEPQDYWDSHPTIHAISKLIKMYSLSVEGLGSAIDDLRQQKVHAPQ